MVLHIHEAEEETGKLWVADRRLWFTADRKRVVEDGDLRAKYLFLTPGKRIPLDEAKRLGITEPPEPDPDPFEPPKDMGHPVAKKAEKVEDKMADPPANKQIVPPQSKRRKKVTKKHGG